MAKVNKIIQPVLPLRDIVVFPNMIVRLFVGREKSVQALEEVMKENKEILLVSQVDATQDEPTEETINKIGVSANVLQILKLPDGAVKILVEGKNRVKIEKFTQNKNDSFGYQFISIQSTPFIEKFAGFWILRDIELIS